MARRIPIVRLLAYYAGLVALAAALVVYVPPVGDALFSPIGGTGAVEDAGAILSGESPRGPTAGPAHSLEATLDRSLTTAMIMFGALALALPIAWVYMHARRGRYDRALVQSVIILPLVVAGIVIVVKDSIALAFSLAGIVAAVRFRNTLQDPRDAVYIFLALGLGLSAGVQALDIALVVTFAFNVVVLVMWRFNLGAVYSGNDTEEGMYGTGDESLFLARAPAERERFRDAVASLTNDMKGDGILLVHGREESEARRGTEAALSEVAKEWRFATPLQGRAGVTTLPVLVRFKKKSSPVELLAELDDHWSAQISAAEYLPLRDGEGDDRG